MMRGNSNKRGMCFLLFLTAFSFGAVKIFHIIENDLKVQYRVETVARSSQGCDTVGTNIAYNSQNSGGNYKIIELPESESIQFPIEDLSVKGTTETSTAAIANCKGNPVNFLGLENAKVCLGGTGQLNYENGQKFTEEVRVKKDAKFKLTKVTYPLAFWLGNFEYIDSNKQILNASTEYRGNGEQIDENYQARHLAPKEAVSFRDSIAKTVRQNFSLDGLIDANPEENKESEVGKYLVTNKDEARCMCKPEVAVSDYNVGKSNYIASEYTEYGGYMRVQVPKGDKYDEKSTECLNEGARFEELLDGVIPACNSKESFVRGLFHELFSPPQWKGCTEGECSNWNSNGVCTEYVKTDDCIAPENITVRMPSIFGDPYKCTDDLCANAFLTYLQKASLAPQAAAGKKVTSGNVDESWMFFVSTPCEAEVENTSGVIEVKCLWDASPLLSNYNLQKKDYAPRSDNEQARSIDYPKTFDQYWLNTDKAITNSAAYYNIPRHVK